MASASSCLVAPDVSAAEIGIQSECSFACCDGVVENASASKMGSESSWPHDGKCVSGVGNASGIESGRER